MARASGWTYVSKISQLVALIVVAAVLVAGFMIPYIGGSGLLAVKATDKFNDTVCDLAISPPQQSSTLLAADSKTVIATFFDQNRQVIPFSQMPQSTVIAALISTEDRRFYSHHGVDLRGLIRAAVHTSNGSTQGGSTLTEQFVKQNNYYTAISRGDTAGANAAIAQNADRKIKDAKCALELERKYSKDEILAMYLNIAFFGENSYGIERASLTYFGVQPNKLTIAQAAMIVGLVQSPTADDPFYSLKNARDRRDEVITNMATAKDIKTGLPYITAAQEAVAKASPIKLAAPSVPQEGCAFAQKTITNVGFFCDYAYNWLITTGGLTRAQVNTGGLRIVTTLNPGLQNQGQAAIAATALDPANDYLLAMPSVDPTTGNVTTMITDKHYGIRANDPSYTTNPIFTAAYAGSGSTYKYFTALAALKAGATPDLTLTAPSPYRMRVCSDPTNVAYRPSNAGNYRATLPLKVALPESSNTYFVAMEDQFFGCNIAPIVNTATGLGMNRLLLKDSNGKTHAQNLIDGNSTTFTLGQEPTSALELTGAFSALANDGVFCPPRPIVAITDTSGAAVQFTKPACSRQYDTYVARTLVNIMTSDTLGYPYGGTASNYFHSWYGQGGSPVAGKTGTNNAAACTDPNNPSTCYDTGGNSALWFVGVTPTLVSAAAIVNPTHPNQQVANVPGVTTDSGNDTFGAFGATFWQDAYATHLLALPRWTWPTVAETPGTSVPANLVGEDLATATSQLVVAGFRANVLTGQTCGSRVTAGNVAYFSPAIALPGAAITLCVSSGVATYAAPAPRPTVLPSQPGATATPGAPAVSPGIPVATPGAPVVAPPVAVPTAPATVAPAAGAPPP